MSGSPRTGTRVVAATQTCVVRLLPLTWYEVATGAWLASTAVAGGINKRVLPSSTTSTPPGVDELACNETPDGRLNARGSSCGLFSERSCHETSTPLGKGSAIKSVSCAIFG